MIQIRSVAIRSDPISLGDRSFTVTGRQWTVALGSRQLGIGASYAAPSHVETDGGSRHPIHDHVLMVRALALVVLTLALLRRTTR